MYEMLTQRTTFEADYEQAIGYGILNEDGGTNGQSHRGGSFVGLLAPMASAVRCGDAGACRCFLRLFLGS
jgi:hypothetical protein